MKQQQKSDGCRFCVNEEYPMTIEFICGWCGRKVVFRLVEVEETIILTEKATRLLEEQVAIPVPVCTG